MSGDAFGLEAFSQRKRYQLRTDLILFLATDTLALTNSNDLTFCPGQDFKLCSAIQYRNVLTPPTFFMALKILSQAMRLSSELSKNIFFKPGPSNLTQSLGWQFN